MAALATTLSARPVYLLATMMVSGSIRPLCALGRAQDVSTSSSNYARVHITQRRLTKAVGTLEETDALWMVAPLCHQRHVLDWIVRWLISRGKHFQTRGDDDCGNSRGRSSRSVVF